jgi:hypothetical protein
MNNNMIVFGTVKVPGHEFIGTMSASQLMRITVDPRRTEDEKTRAADASMQATYEIRKQVQREFAGAKAKNVESYADYICRIAKGEDGITPAIVLWTAEKLNVIDADGYLPRLELPWSIELVAIDGETQLAARFEAKAKNPETQEMMVDVKICYNRSTAWAGQAFHDLNVFSIRPNAATAVSMDMRDPLTHVTRTIADMPFFSGRIKSDRQLSKKSNGIATLSVLRSSLVCFAEGIGGVQYGNKSVPVPVERLSEIQASAVEYYTALSEQVWASDGGSPQHRDRDSRGLSRSWRSGSPID